MNFTLDLAGQLAHPERKEALSIFKRIVLALVAIDLGLIFINIIIAGLRGSGLISGNIDAWLVFHETSIGSYFTYIKWAILVVTLAAIALRNHGASIQLVLAALFLYILLDDTLQMHEFYGALIASSLGLTTTLAVPAEDLGQLIFLTGVGAMFAVLAVIAFFVSARIWRQVAISFFAALLGLAFFGVGVDVIHSMTNSLPPGQIQKMLDVGLAIFEDGGEMIFASILAALAVAVWLKPPPQTQDGDERT
ncbi:MAG: hypothetical protein RLN72_01985 [Henriciella sp.]